MITIDGFQANCVHGDVQSENIFADVHLPSNILSIHPETKDALAAVVQQVIEVVGVPHVKFTKNAWDKSSWIYGLDVTHRKRNGANTYPLPEPYGHSSRYGIWGRAPSTACSNSAARSIASQLPVLDSAPQAKSYAELELELEGWQSRAEVAELELLHEEQRAEQYVEVEIAFLDDINQRDIKIRQLEEQLTKCRICPSTSNETPPEATPPSTPRSKPGKFTPAVSASPSEFGSSPSPSSSSSSSSSVTHGWSGSDKSFGLEAYECLRRHELSDGNHSLLHYIRGKLKEEKWESAVSYYVSLKHAREIAQAMSKDNAEQLYSA